jgi:hypothetical protein
MLRQLCDHISRAVREERPNEATLDDAVTNMRIIDRLFASASSGHFEQP